MDYYMKFLKFLSLLHKHGLSYAVSGISFSFTKTWTIICNFYNFFLFPKNVDYHMQFMKFFSLIQKCGLLYAISRIFFLPQKRGLLYAISEISFPSTKTWTNICNL